MNVSVVEREADILPLFCQKIKNTWKCNSMLPIRLSDMYRGSFLTCTFNFFAWFDVFTVGAVKVTVVWEATLHPLARLPVSCRHSEQRCPAGWQPTLFRFTYVVAQAHKSLLSRNIYGGGKFATLGCVRPKKRRHK
jgi:hypothetical protein